MAYLLEQKVASFWSRVDRNGPIPTMRPELGNCWIWKGCVSDEGYGTFVVGGPQSAQKRRGAHRVVFFLLNGRWPEPEIDHLCHNTLCVRPDHLREATHTENMNNRACSMICKRGHPLAGANLYFYSGGRRRCVACYQLRLSEARAARRARGLKKPGRKAVV